MNARGFPRYVPVLSLCLLQGCADTEPILPPAAPTVPVDASKIQNVDDQSRSGPQPVRAVSMSDSPRFRLSNHVERVDLQGNRDPEDPYDTQKDPFGITGFYKVKSIQNVRFSPDGRTVLFSVTSVNLKKGTSNTDLYSKGFDGLGLRQITRSEKYDGDGTWTPDGKSILFVSSRSGTHQIWRIPAQGGKPVQLTNLATGADNPVISPDGKKLAFVSRVYPEYGADDDENADLIADQTISPFRAHIADDLLFRHWDDWAEQKRSHILVLDLATQKIVDVTPGDFDSPVFSLGDDNFVFSPDSMEICFSSNREEPGAQSWTTNSDLWVALTEGGDARCLTEKNKASDTRPVYSPDGRYIAYAKQSVPGYESDRTRVALYDRESRTTRILTEGFDHSAEHIKWTPDSKRLIFSANRMGRNPLFEVGIEGGPVKTIGHIPSVEDFDVAEDGKLAFTFSRIGKPVELYISYLLGNTVGKLTRLNSDLETRYDIRPAEEFWFDAPGGRRIHTFIIKPHGFDPKKKYPLILNVHGGPQAHWSDRLRGDWQVYPAAGYVVALPNPTGSTGFGQAFTAAISKDWGGKVHEDILSVAEGLKALEYVDENRMGAMGWSYGGYLINWIAGHPHPFKALASMMGIFDLSTFYLTTEELWFPEWDLGGTPWESPENYAKWNPANHIESMNTPTLIIAGEKDFRIPFTQSLMLFTALRRRGVPARLIVFPNDGHWPSGAKSMPLYYAAHLDWFHQYLGGDPSPFDIHEMVRGRGFLNKVGR